MCKFNLIASFLWIYHFVLSFTKNAVWFSDTTSYLLVRLIIGQFVLLKDTLKQACSIYKVCTCIEIWLLCNVKFTYTGTKILKKWLKSSLPYGTTTLDWYVATYLKVQYVNCSARKAVWYGKTSFFKPCLHNP